MGWKLKRIRMRKRERGWEWKREEDWFSWKGFVCELWFLGRRSERNSPKAGPRSSTAEECGDEKKSWHIRHFVSRFTRYIIRYVNLNCVIFPLCLLHLIDSIQLHVNEKKRNVSVLCLSLTLSLIYRERFGANILHCWIFWTHPSKYILDVNQKIYFPSRQIYN